MLTVPANNLFTIRIWQFVYICSAFYFQKNLKLCQSDKWGKRSKLKPEKGHISDEILSGSETRHIYILEFFFLHIPSCYVKIRGPIKKSTSWVSPSIEWKQEKRKKSVLTMATTTASWNNFEHTSYSLRNVLRALVRKYIMRVGTISGCHFIFFASCGSWQSGIQNSTIKQRFWAVEAAVWQTIGQKYSRD